MAVPTLIVEIAFDDGPFISSPVWTEVTTDVQSVSINRGRSDDFSEDFVSTGTVVLNNNLRKYDPFNALSPYLGKLKPRRQIRIQGVANGVTYPIFQGFINGFPVSWENSGKISTVTLDLFDILALVSTTEIKGDLAEVYTKSLFPVHYYRCSEPSGTTTFKDLGSANQNVEFAAVGATQPTSYNFLGLGLSGTSVNVGNSYFGKLASATATSGDMTVSLWSAGNGTPDRTLFFFSGGSHSFRAVVESSGQIVLTVNGYPVVSVNSTYSSTIPHHYLFTYKYSTGIATIYVDGVNQTSGTGATSAGFVFFPTSNLLFGGGIYQEVACFNKVLTAEEIANIYNFGQGSQTETTGQRLNRLMMLTDFNSTTGPNINTTRWDVSDPATASISGVPEPNETIIDSIQKAIVTESGHLFVKRDGILKATSRAFFSGLTSVVTFTDTGTNGFRYRDDIDIWYDGDNMRNDIVVKYGIGGASFASGLFNPESINQNGRHTLTVESQTSNETQARTLAQHLLRYGIIDPPSISKFEVGLSATTVQWQTLLSLELLNRITFKRTPAVGTPLSKDLLINSIDFALTPKVWSMKITGSSRYTTTFLSREVLGAGFGTSSTSFVVKDTPEIQSIAVPAYNQDSATFSAQVNAKGFSTTIRFQYSTDPAFGSYTELTPTPSTAAGSSWTSTSVSVSGLTHDTTYYMRVKATSSIGTVYGSYGGFTTYKLKTVIFTSSGTWTAPTWGGTASPTAFYVQAVGGGGGSGGYGGGGGGGAGQNSVLSATLAASMVAVIGAGGADYANGGSTTLTNLAGSAGGGNTPVPVGEPPILFYYNGGSSSSGNAGGSGYGDFFNGIYAGGGGGGAGGVGSNYSGSNGGAGGASSTTTYWSIGYGSGGGGHATSGSTGTTPVSLYGGGGSYNTIQIQSGVILFIYYGPAGERSGTGWSENNY